jgi:hypothetical protein
MDFKVNFNEQVKVKLTDFGISILKERRNELNKQIEKRGGKGFGEYEVRKDKDGYTNFQLWDLMNTFGNNMTLASKMCFDADIIITNGETMSDKQHQEESNERKHQSASPLN